MVAARSYGEMISFGNAQIASSLSGMGTNSTNKLCRLGSDGKMICDIPTGLSGSNTANRLCRTDASGTLQCSTNATICGAGQVSKWNGSSFECVNTRRSTSCYWKTVPNRSMYLQCNDAGIEYVAGIRYEWSMWNNWRDYHSYPEVDQILCCRTPGN
jgi:hypothetical protein